MEVEVLYKDESYENASYKCKITFTVTSNTVKGLITLDLRSTSPLELRKLEVGEIYNLEIK